MTWDFSSELFAFTMSLAPLVRVALFNDLRVRNIRNGASSYTGILFQNSLPRGFYCIASSPGYPLPHLLDGCRDIVGVSAIPAFMPRVILVFLGRYRRIGRASRRNARIDDTPPTTSTYYEASRLLNHYTHPTNQLRDKKTDAFDPNMASPSRQRHYFAVGFSHISIVTVAGFGHSHQRRQ